MFFKHFKEISSEVGIVASSEIVYKLNNAVGSRDN
jgi:hypothetical protein